MKSAVLAFALSAGLAVGLCALHGSFSSVVGTISEKHFTPAYTSPQMIGKVATRVDHPATYTIVVRSLDGNRERYCEVTAEEYSQLAIGERHRCD